MRAPISSGWAASVDASSTSSRARSSQLPNYVLRKLADNPAIQDIHWDRPTGGAMNYAAVTVGARAVQENLGFDGAGVGVAVIDSGITAWHDDLTYRG